VHSVAADCRLSFNFCKARKVSFISIKLLLLFQTRMAQTTKVMSQKHTSRAGQSGQARVRIKFPASLTMRVLWAAIFISFLWHGADCFSRIPITNLPLVIPCKKSAAFARVHDRHFRQLFTGRQARTVVRMMSPEGEATINVVEGPFQGQFGLWFVDTHDAQVFSLVLKCDYSCIVIF
jgi:hypothetical protein